MGEPLTEVRGELKRWRTEATGAEVLRLVLDAAQGALGERSILRSYRNIDAEIFVATLTLRLAAPR